MSSEIYDLFWKTALTVFIVRYVWRLLKELIGMINYFRADKYAGCVVKSLGTVEQTALISGHSTNYHTFESYLVEYNYNGQKLQDNIISARKGLKSGDYLAVHVIEKNGVPEIQTDTCGAKIRFLILILLFSVAATIALVAFVTLRYS